MRLEIKNNEDLIETSKILPNKIKISLEKGKTLGKEYNENEISNNINDCIEIENNIQDINSLNKSIEKGNSNKNNEIKFNSNEDEINDMLEK